MKIKDLIEQVNSGKIKSDIDLQREIVYSEEKQILVIDSIVNDIPLPAFYFWKNESDVLEVLDGKQRIEAITQFVHNNLEYEEKLWKQSSPQIQTKINETELSVIISSGDVELKRKIFYRINTLGVPLSDFEVLNGLYSGEYLRGITSFVKQDKETIRVFGSNSRGKVQYDLLKLIVRFFEPDCGVSDYVEKQQNKTFVDDQKKIKPFINFVREIFNDYANKDILFYLARRYLKNKSIWINKKDEINNVVKLYIKSDYYKLTKNKTQDYEKIILATIDGQTVDTKRAFSQEDKEELLQASQKNDEGLFQCNGCQQHYDKSLLEVDHIVPWSLGGRTDLTNAQLLCRNCNRRKSNKE
ncbi:MAG: hypothetical protein Ta2B_15240 [Termitinemataceae bacterium]|nr:MAG: hypothetical protein Ta2B_15240 [Termitinemataceae bacterium]